MGIPVFLDMADDDQTLPMTYPAETFNNSHCQFATFSSSSNTATVSGGRSTTPPPALPPRHPHRRLAPHVQPHTQYPSPASNLHQYQPFYYQQQQVQLQQRNSELDVLYRQQQQQQQLQHQSIHPRDLNNDRTE